CSSESQNRSAMAASMLQAAALNHQTKAPATPWFGSRPSDAICWRLPADYIAIVTCIPHSYVWNLLVQARLTT
ncbi:hypothetical protein, partial [Methylobacterium oryzisoli]